MRLTDNLQLIWDGPISVNHLAEGQKMAIHHPVRHTDDNGELKGCNLILHHGNPNSFALTCSFQGEPHIAVLDAAALGNVPVPLVDQFSGECLSFGLGFLINFSHEDVKFNGAVSVGDLIIVADKLYVRCMMARGYGSGFLLDLNSGDISALRPPYAVVHHWSMLIDTSPQRDGTAVVTVFSRGARGVNDNTEQQ